MQTAQTEDEVIRLTEYVPHSLYLEAQDRAYLQERFASRLSLSQMVVDDVTLDVIDPGPHVGVVAMPSGRRLECRPKVDAGNLLYMMAVAYEFPRLEVEEAPFDSMSEVLEFVVDHFALLAEERIRNGLFRHYLDVEENLGTIRGRILFARDVVHNFALRHRTYCEYSELSWDVRENQVVRQVASQMSRWPFRRELRAKLDYIDGVMAEVSQTRYQASVIDTLTYSRLTEEYRPLHQLCRLLMQASSMHEDEGYFESQTFLVDMNQLFESFLTQVLLEGMPQEFEVLDQETTHLDTAGEVDMRPDVLIKLRRMPLGVIDAKYKKLASGEYKHHDLYQVLAYCTAHAVARGMLVYPRHMEPIEQDIRVRNSPVVVRQSTLDLGGDLDTLRANVERFVAGVAKWAGAH
jgi:5-methylcytosine-specific restriction enzyme subunit McrC